MKLHELKIGESAIITGFEKENDSYRKKLLSLGLNEGTKIHFVRKSPFNDPIVIEALGRSAS